MWCAPGATSGSGKHRSSSAANPDYVRSLVASAPIRDAPATAVVYEAPQDATIHATSSASTPRNKQGMGDAWNAHLAQLLHGMYLVTLIEKAQLGAIYANSGSNTALAQDRRSCGGVVTSGESSPSEPSTAFSTAATGARAGAVSLPCKFTHSITIDGRWLDAVTRYCHSSFTPDDVARVAMVFPTFVQVRWSLEPPSRSSAASASLNDISGTESTLARNRYGAQNTKPPSARNKEDDGGVTVANGRTESHRKLRGRVYLLQNRVVSVEEALGHLTYASQRHGSAVTQRAWKALVNHHTAYAAYMDALDEHAQINRSQCPTGSQAPANASKTTSQTAGDRQDVDMPPSITDDKLLEQVSMELRASLSEPKLQALLQQMRQDAAHVEDREQQRIARRQLQERLLHAYEHVRALFGPRHTRGRNAMSLIRAMQQESRFDDVLDSAALLSSLLALPASRLTATRLCESQVKVEPSAPPAPVKGMATRRKRQRAADEAAVAPPEVHVTEPFLEKVTDLQGLTADELELVLVQLDRAKGSVSAVLAATNEQEV